MGILRVHPLPRLVEPSNLAGSTCLVIDVLRATTTMSHALAAGARDVLPCLEIADALKAAAALPREAYLLGGERAGVKIDGFDLGNSPGEYRPELVKDKTLIFTTTNGTRALLHCEQAAEVLLAAFVNLSAVCRRVAPIVAASGGRVDVVCAGTGGEVTREDVLLAGAIADRLLALADDWNDSAVLAADGWRGALAAARARPDDSRALGAILRDSRGGRNLQRLELAADIDDSARVDSLSVVPRYDHHTGRITLGD